MYIIVKIKSNFDAIISPQEDHTFLQNKYTVWLQGPFCFDPYIIFIAEHL